MQREKSGTNRLGARGGTAYWAPSDLIEPLTNAFQWMKLSGLRRGKSNDVFGFLYFFGKRVGFIWPL